MSCYSIFCLFTLFLINLLFVGKTAIAEDPYYSDDYYEYFFDENQDEIYKKKYNKFLDVYIRQGLDNIFPGIPRDVLFVNVQGDWLEPGQNVDLHKLLTPPTVYWHHVCEPNEKYMLLLLNKNAPTLLEGQVFVQWLYETNSCSTLEASLVSSYPYVPPTPPPGTGPNLYILALYRTSHDNLVGLLKDRVALYPAKFGTPVAATMFFSGILKDIALLPKSPVKVPLTL